MRTVYKAIAILSDGKRLIGYDDNYRKELDTREQAEAVIKAWARDTGNRLKAGSFIVQFDPSNHSSKIVEFKIYTRQVTEWEEC